MIGTQDDHRHFVRAPEPFSHITASPAFSPHWGHGWLGYTVVGDAIDLWFVYGDLHEALLLDHNGLSVFNDRSKSHVWMILISSKTHDHWVDRNVMVFLLNPPVDGVVFPIPGELVTALEGM